MDRGKSPLTRRLFLATTAAVLVVPSRAAAWTSVGTVLLSDQAFPAPQEDESNAAWVKRISSQAKSGLTPVKGHWVIHYACVFDRPVVQSKVTISVFEEDDLSRKVTSERTLKDASRMHGTLKASGKILRAGRQAVFAGADRSAVDRAARSFDLLT